MAMTVRRDRQCNAPSLARSRSDLELSPNLVMA